MTSLSCQHSSVWIDYAGIYKHVANIVSFSTTLASLFNMSEKYNLHHLVQSK